ncbi:MAG: tetratricopeptide repeat protein, partial [Neisseriaceae bacterium]|nr:tetratricopeptide repeat protein [Neisseriaceae bacterium]
MSNNQTPYSKQQVEELKKEIEGLSECVDDNTRKVLTQCTLKLNNARQDNLDKTIAKIEFNLGIFYHKQGEIKQAKQHWLNIQGKHDVKRYAMAQFNLGVLYYEQDDIEQAKQHWLNIQEEHDLEQYAKAQFNLGFLYDEQDDIEQTKQHWQNIQEKHG